MATIAATNMTDETMIRNTTDIDEDHTDSNNHIFLNREALESYLIDNQELRLQNIKEQMDNLLGYYAIYFFFISTLILQLTLFPHLKIQVSFLILIFFHVYKTYFYFKKLFDREFLIQ